MCVAGKGYGVKTRIKICGLKRSEDIAFVNEAGADFAGFVIHVPKSPRNTTASEAARLSALLSPKICPVGVFVDEPEETVARLLNSGVIRLAQLHGQEDEGYLGRLRRLTEGKVIQAFSVRNKEDLMRAARSSADYILLDHGRGGTGRTFDWSLVKQMERPWFLAGGLDRSNLLQAIKQLHPWAVDLSSGVETKGRKDREKIKATVALAHGDDGGTSYRA